MVLGCHKSDTNGERYATFQTVGISRKLFPMDSPSAVLNLLGSCVFLYGISVQWL